MRKTVFIIDLSVIFSALGTCAFLSLAEHISTRALRGQSLPALTQLAYDYKSIVVIIAILGVCGTLVKTIKGTLKESDILLYLALAVLFISSILFASLIAAMLPHIFPIEPLR